MKAENEQSTHMPELPSLILRRRFGVGQEIILECRAPNLPECERGINFLLEKLDIAEQLKKKTIQKDYHG